MEKAERRRSKPTIKEDHLTLERRGMGPEKNRGNNEAHADRHYLVMQII